MKLRTGVVIGFAVAVLVISGLGFVFKMTEFSMTIVNNDIEGFGTVSVLIYLLGMLPMVMLNLWAVFSGKFRDIERPKYRIFELEREIERGGELEERHA